MVREYPPYNFPYAGRVYNDSLGNVGSFGDYWSRTAFSSNNAYVLDFGSSVVLPTYFANRYLGYSIRCVATT